MFNPVRAEEMAFAISIFVSAANGQIFPSAPPDVQASLRERRSCQRFVSFLAAEDAECGSLWKAATSQETPLFRAIFAVWEHDREDSGRLSIVARVLAFYSLMERTEGAVLERWCDRNPEGEETVLLHPAVIEAIAGIPLGSRGQLHANDFVQAVEAAAETHLERTVAGQVTLLEQRTESGEAMWPFGEGEVACLMRRFDWSTTPLGPLRFWPQSLKTAADLTLACRFPMIVLWGPELIQIYNDSYREVMGRKHPAGLGQPTQRCWPEVWQINEPIYAKVLQGESVTFEDHLYPIVRYGYLEDVYFTLCYSPLRNEQAQVQGVLVTVFETTDRVLKQQAEREHRALPNGAEAVKVLPEPAIAGSERRDGNL